MLEEVYELASDLAAALVVLDETDLVSLGCATQRGRLAHATGHYL